MRKGLAISAVLASLVLAGCSGGSDETGPTTDASAPPSEPTATQSARTAPAKSLDIDRCSIVSQAQAKQLGADQQPRERDSNGTPGCNYDLGTSGAGFMVFLAADKAETMQKFADARRSNVKMIDIGGYPAARVGTNKTNCLLSLDISDKGSLYVNTLVPSGTPNPCDLSMQFAEAALQNLPNA
ncbi:DUF3558 domain-containing protein [Saccharopolyspora phatthalungensis]|uniref:DUF3558 domain-containing protein n=1 Tax=Saccharopolyspora phatthalungensis TaxID=664693 RepID=A0A840Q1S5_9PSEU|nr:DUF3558 domain-containing protein [Saccharopolyspora phatthalungensis]MBB5152738.1 hypothetical protein [Saccharopolyspora phatthalungensis]